MKTQSTSQHTLRGEITTDNLRALVRHLLPSNVPAHAEIRIEFRVPGGGDYSGMALDVAEYPLDVVATWVDSSADGEVVL